MPVSPRENPKHLKLLLHGLFLVSGSVTVLIGQVLPILSRQYGLNDLESGFCFPSQFGGSLAGTLLTARFARRDQYIPACMIGALLMACGIILLNIDSFPFTLFAFAINGVGIGMTLPAINMTLIELSPKNPASALSILNFCWGVGAILCKPFVDASSRDSSILITTSALAVPLFASAALLYFHPVRIISDRVAAGSGDAANEPIWRLPLAWGIALFNFIHVGFESGMSGWITTYTERLDEAHIVQWLSPTLAYFSLFVLGRGAAPILFRFLNENRMLMLGLLTVMAGILIAVTTRSVWILGTGAAIAGFGTSWIFPTNVARFSRAFGPAAARRSTPFFICGTLGAASSTWLIGFVSNQTGDLRFGMYTLAAAVALLIVLQIALSLKRTEAAN
jgi:MFS transporter, FHS family, glucose/mannose:H+ symporter